MLENAVRICEANFGTLFRLDGKGFISRRVRPSAKTTPSSISAAGSFNRTGHAHLIVLMRTKSVGHTADDAAKPTSPQLPS